MAISTVQEPEEILHRVLSGSVSHDIHQWVDELREAQPIIHSEAYGGWYVLRYDAVSELLLVVGEAEVHPAMLVASGRHYPRGHGDHGCCHLASSAGGSTP